MTKTIPHDRSNGYENLADTFIRTRNTKIGAATIEMWSKTLPPKSPVLDMGCGPGIPVSRVLDREGFVLYGIDASAKMIAAYHERFPTAQTECSTAEESQFFHRTFDGIVAWGVIFLLSVPNQTTVIAKVAQALNPGGRFLFTSPREATKWHDALTGLPSVSLGREGYKQLLYVQGLVLLGEHTDEGDNHYYSVLKPQS
jgi:2-polyprenyl-3-methyl-5-hydroxy-6-metoxy-1,4-benzoquinol methylase